MSKLSDFLFNSKNNFCNGLGVMLYGLPGNNNLCKQNIKNISIQEQKKIIDTSLQIKTVHEFIKNIPNKNRDSNGNIIVVINENNSFDFFPEIKGLKIDFRNNGKNNTIVLYEGAKYENSRIVVGNNNICIIEKTNYYLRNLSILLHTSRNSIFKVGKNFLCWGVEFQSRDERNFFIGDNVLISYGISIWNVDGHTIFDANKEVLNYSKDVIIGNKVWIGHKAEILKGTVIQDNSVIGACSVVNKAFSESNVIIAGQPAKIVKRGITWDGKSPISFPPSGS